MTQQEKEIIVAGFALFAKQLADHFGPSHPLVESLQHFLQNPRSEASFHVFIENMYLARLIDNPNFRYLWEG